MKKSTLLTLALTGSLLAALSFAADTKKAAPAATKAAPAPAAAPAAPQQQKLVRVATLKSVEANREFQNNVQLLQAQRQQAVELGTALEKEPNAAKKKELKTKVDDLNAAIRAWAPEAEVVLLDPWSILAEADGTWKAGYTDDGIHPNMSAAALMSAYAGPVILDAWARHLNG